MKWVSFVLIFLKKYSVMKLRKKRKKTTVKIDNNIVLGCIKCPECSTI